MAAAKLSELHGLDLGAETLRQWMIGAGLGVRRKDWLKRIECDLSSPQMVQFEFQPEGERVNLRVPKSVARRRQRPCRKPRIPYQRGKRSKPARPAPTQEPEPPTTARRPIA